MSSESQPLPISVYRLLLFCYPPTFRDEFGEQEPSLELRGIVTEFLRGLVSEFGMLPRPIGISGIEGVYGEL